MVNYEEIINEIVNYANLQPNPTGDISRDLLFKHFLNKDKSFDKRTLNEVLEEMSTRGDLLKINSGSITLDPVCF